MNDMPQNYSALIATIDDELIRLEAEKAAERSRIALLDEQQAALGHHPNYTAYIHGGIPAIRGMGVSHILAHAGFYVLPHGDATAWLTSCAMPGGCLITALRELCESDPLLEIAGEAWLGEQGLLKRGRIDSFWLRRPLLGLGQPAKLYDLEPHHAHGHRGLYTLDPSELSRCFSDIAVSRDQTFGELLLPVIRHGGLELAKLGADAIEADAARRYEDDCARFAEHQRRHGDRRWRWKPALSRQGHLAITTAQVRDVPLAAERSRGHAANWLNDHGANPRFREDFE